MSDEQNTQVPGAEVSDASGFDFASSFRETLSQEGAADATETTQPVESQTGQDPSEVQGEVAAQQGGTEPQSPSALLAQRFGLDPTRFQSDDEVIEALRKEREYAAQLQQYAEQARYQLAQYQAMLQQQAQPVPQPTPEKPKWYNPPPLDREAAERWATTNEKGEFAWKEGTPSEIKQAVEAHYAYKRKFRESFENDPEAALAPVLDERERRAYERAKQDTLQELRAQEASKEARQFLSPYADHFFVKDASGNQLRDPYTGGPMLNDVGQEFQRHEQYLRTLGVNDPLVLARECLDRVKGNLALKVLAEMQKGQSQPQQQTPPSSLSQQFTTSQKDLLQRAIRQPNRSGSFSPGPDDPPQNARLNPAQMFKQQLAADGVDWKQAYQAAN